MSARSARRLRSLAVAVAFALLADRAVAQPAPPSTVPRISPTAHPAELLGNANEALAAGDPAAAASLAERALERTPSPADRTEANRVLGLARFFLGHRAGAEAAFVEYLVLDAEAHLDPTLVPPEAIVFFEDVRARHAGELAARRPRRARRRSPWLAPLPIYSQVQNGQPAKAWILGGAGATLLAVNLGTYLWLRAHCHRQDGTCYGGSSDPSSPSYRDLTGVARTAKVVNLVAAAGLASVALYAVVDGVIGYRRLGRGDGALAARPAPIDHGFGVALVGRF